MIFKKLLIKDNIILVYTGVAVVLGYWAFVDYKAGNYLAAIFGAFVTGVYGGYISLRFIAVRLEGLVAGLKEANKRDYEVIKIQNELINEQNILIGKLKQMTTLEEIIKAANDRG